MSRWAGRQAGYVDLRQQAELDLVLVQMQSRLRKEGCQEAFEWYGKLGIPSFERVLVTICRPRSADSHLEFSPPLLMRLAYSALLPRVDIVQRQQ